MDAVIARIRAFRRQKNLNRTTFAEMAGVAESSIRYIDDPSWNPTSEMLRKLSAVIPADFVIATAAPENSAGEAAD